MKYGWIAVILALALFSIVPAKAQSCYVGSGSNCVVFVSNLPSTYNGVLVTGPTGYPAISTTLPPVNLTDPSIIGSLVLNGQQVVNGECVIGQGGNAVWGNCSGSGGSGINQLTGDATAGPGTGSQALTFSTVNGSPGTTTCSTITTNGKGLVTANATGSCSGGSSAFSGLTSGTNTTAAMLVGSGASFGATGSGAITATAAPLGGISGFGTGVGAALAGNVGSAGAPVVNGGALGTPSSGVGTNLTGTASGLTAGSVPASGITGQVSVGSGGTGIATLPAGAVPMGAGTSPFAVSEISDTGSGGMTVGSPTGGQKGAGTINVTGCFINNVACASGSAPSFSAVTSGTNTSAAMIVGTGASMAASGSGSIIATAAPLAGISGFGTGVATALGINVGTAGGVVVNGGALGTPSSGTLINTTGLPLSTGVTGTLPAANMLPLTTGDVYVGNGSNQPAATAFATPAATYLEGLNSGTLTYCYGSTTASGAPLYNTCPSAGGTPVVFTGTTAGTANAQTIASPLPSGYTLTDQTEVRFKVGAGLANTASAPTLNVNGTGTEPEDIQSGGALVALPIGYLQPALQYSATYQAACTCYVVTTIPGGGLTKATTSAPGTGASPTAAQWASYQQVNLAAASLVSTVPVSTTLSPGGGEVLYAINSGTLTATSPDTITTNAGVTSAGGSISLAGGTVTFVTTDGAGHIYAVGNTVIPPIPASISWAPSQNLAGATNGIGLFTAQYARTVIAISCRPDTAVGGTATIDVWIAPSGTALGSGTKVTTTSCDANGTAAYNQTGLASSSVSVPIGDTIGIVASGAGWSSSVGAGSLTVSVQ